MRSRLPAWLWLSGLLLLCAPAARAATITVDTTANAGVGNCTLQEAVQAANGDAVVDACAAGSGADVIDLTGLTGTIELSAPLLLTTDVVIRGPGARNLRISGVLIPSTQMIRNDSGATVQIEDVTIGDKLGLGLFESCLIPCEGQLVLERVRVTNCRVDPDEDIFFTDGMGGAMSTNCGGADVTIRDSLFDANVATGSTAGGSIGGAIWWAGRDLTIVNTTFSGNSAEAKGGALWSAGTTILRSTTFSGNASASGAALEVAGGTTTAENSVFANSTGPSCAVGGATFTSLGHNLSDDASCDLAGVGDQSGVASGLGLLADNGGPTDTHAPTLASPLRDAGDPAGCPDESGVPLLADQRGRPRPFGAACDVGAVEADGACPSAPLAGCRSASVSTLKIAAGSDPAKRRLGWSWKKGDEVMLGDLGDPSATTDYGLCVFDAVDGVATLALDALVAPGSAWKASGAKGWKYKDKGGTAYGVVSIALKSGDAGKASAKLEARGANLPAIAPNDGSELFDQDPAVTVQLLSETGLCWSSEFEPEQTQQNDAARFSAKAP